VLARKVKKKKTMEEEDIYKLTGYQAYQMMP